MADHVSAAKRARQSLKRAERNRKVRSSVKTAIKNALEGGAQKDAPKNAQTSAAALSEAFSAIQKSRGVFHRNTVKRKMARLAKAVAKKAQKA